MKNIFLLLLFLISFCPKIQAADTAKKLATISDFAFGGVGITVATSEGELLFRKIYKGASVKKDFVAILAKGNIQAKCYALVALRQLDPEIYHSSIDKFKKDKTSVSFLGGCGASMARVYSVAFNIDAGVYDKYVLGCK